MNAHAPKVRGLRVRAVRLKIAQPLETASGSFATWPVVLLDLQTEDGPVGHAYVGCFMPMMVQPLVSLLKSLGTMIEGEPLSPLDIDRRLRASARLIGVQGSLATAIALIEVAAWDALARCAQWPLARLLGARPRTFPVYKTLVSMVPETAAELARQAIEAGYGGVKLKFGAPTADADAKLLKAVRRVTGEAFPVMADYNQVLSVPEAMQRIRALDGEGLTWLEEPVAARDFAGCARIADAVTTPIQVGENWTSVAEAEACIAAGAADLAMPDLIKIGGVSAWLRTATVCEAHRIPVSAHSFPETCAHLMAACETAHWLEHVGMADQVLANPVKPQGGVLAASGAPGNGVDWDEDVIARSLIE